MNNELTWILNNKWTTSQIFVVVNIFIFYCVNMAVATSDGRTEIVANVTPARKYPGKVYASQ